MKTLAGFARIAGIMSPKIVEKVCRFHFFRSFVGITHEIRKEIKFWIIPETLHHHLLSLGGLFAAVQAATKFELKFCLNCRHK